MKLTSGQGIAYDKIMKWIADPSLGWKFVLAGYAGTGKTTLMQHIINNMETIPFCCAPTAKAASVLDKKLENAIVTTVHKALYSPIIPSSEGLKLLIASIAMAKNEKEKSELQKEIEEEKKKMKKEKLQFSCKLRQGEYLGYVFVVDEASMITPDMAEDFHFSGARVIFVGDPGQLPPVKAKEWFCKDGCDAMLTEITRQALDSPIIRLSMEIREKGTCNYKNYFDCDEITIAQKNKYDAVEWLKKDQVLVGSNNLRRRINRYFRKQHENHESVFPVNGEKLICLKNDMENHGLINGLPATCTNSEVDDFNDLRLSVLIDDELKSDMIAYKYPFEIHYDKKANELPWMLKQDMVEFDFAYAITVHKSQGSEWGDVLLADDGFMSTYGGQRKKWLYTAITRAKKTFTWIRD